MRIRRVYITPFTRQSCSNIFHTFARPFTTDSFLRRHVGIQKDDIGSMLRQIGASSLDELIDLTIPPQIRSDPQCQKDIHPAMRGLVNERKALEALKKISAKNQPTVKSLIGQGYVNATTPAVLRRLVLENPGWYTAYTPYQPEISQGRLEALLTYQVFGDCCRKGATFFFQTSVCELTGMEIANASLLDESTAAAEAMLMLYRIARLPSSSMANFSIHA